MLKVEACWEGRVFFWWRAAFPCAIWHTFLWPTGLCQRVFLCSQHDEHGPLGHYSIAQIQQNLWTAIKHSRGQMGRWWSNHSSLSNAQGILLDRVKSKGPELKNAAKTSLRSALGLVHTCSFVSTDVLYMGAGIQVCSFSLGSSLRCWVTGSQNGRGWKGPLWVTQSNPPAEAGSPTVGCTGPCPGGSWISPEKETPQPLWAACSTALSPSEGRSSSSHSDGNVWEGYTETSSAICIAHCSHISRGQMFYHLLFQSLD